jgi:hypothetical protein
MALVPGDGLKAILLATSASARSGPLPTGEFSTCFLTLGHWDCPRFR